MKYMGSKRRIAKEILPIILKDRRPGQYYVEPFCGGCNTIDKVDGPRIASDSNKYLIALLSHVQSGGEMPDYVSEQEYNRVKNSCGIGVQDWYMGFVGFSCSFGSKFFGGFARNIKKTDPNSELLNSSSHNYCAESKRNLLKQSQLLRGIEFLNSEYSDLQFPPQSIIYCDPPYKLTTGYKTKFDHEKFYLWLRKKKSEGHIIFISEYQMPDGFICVWQKEIKNNMDSNRDKSFVCTEKLFTF